MCEIRLFCCVCGMEKINDEWTKIVPKKEQPAGLSSHGFCPEHLAEMREKLNRIKEKMNGVTC